MSLDWKNIAQILRNYADMPALGWRFDQDASLRWIADRIDCTRGLLIADEVGLGKTRLAIAVMHAVAEAGGKVGVVVPPTLLHQWETEYIRFARALGKPAPLQAAKMRDRRQIRNFMDLFPDSAANAAAQPSAYPLGRNQPFLLISQNFGLPGKIGPRSRPYAWALPYLVRSFALHGSGNWHGAPGLRDSLGDSRFSKQVAAALWLTGQPGWAERLAALPPLSREGQTGENFMLSQGRTAVALRSLFHALIGRLLGPVDLLVIDEAHKSRENLQEGAVPAKRLSCLLEEILPQAASGRRLCLTATPIQLGEADWRSTLRRMNIGGTDLERRMNAVADFEAARAQFRFGPATDQDVTFLCDAASRFQAALADVVTRRRWDEQPIMREARAVFGTTGAHPHRRWTDKNVAWRDLSLANRLAALAVEGQALAARGTSLGIVERHRSARHAQAMDVAEPSDPDADEGDAPPASAEAAVLRHAHWRKLHAAARRGESGLGDDALIEHPRIIAACEWIEQVTDVLKSKVLVFGSYNKPLAALANAINLRRYVRDISTGRPALPVLLRRRSITSTSPPLGAVLRILAGDGAMPDAKDVAELMQQSSRSYESASRDLARSIDEVLEKEALRDGPLRTIVRLAALERLLEAPPEDQIDLSSLVRDLVRTMAVSAKDDDLRDRDGSTSRAGSLALMEALEQEQAQAGRGRGEFARVLMGGSNAATRHLLQALFNTPHIRPNVLVAQSRVASEGLNLHEACRHVMFLHLDWNPSLIEQQIGRVDRVQSLWARQFAAAGDSADLPRIELATVVLEGTSDAEKRSRIRERQKLLGAHLFGEILEPDIMNHLKPEWAGRLREASPIFSPVIQEKS